MAIEFNKTTGELVFSLMNFVNKGAGHPVIGYEFCFNNDGFEGKLYLEAELFDLEDLLKGLAYMNDNLKGEFYFEPMISGRIKIKFKITDQGQMNVEGLIQDPSFSTKLSFKFLSDQTMLPGLISQCKAMINSLKEVQ